MCEIDTQRPPHKEPNKRYDLQLNNFHSVGHP